jgi:hypothetical protein
VITAQGQRQQNATIRSTIVMAGLEHFPRAVKRRAQAWFFGLGLGLARRLA